METVKELISAAQAWLDQHLAPCRLTCLALMSAFFVYHTVDYYNFDMYDLNELAERRSQIGKEFQRREDLNRNLDNIAGNYARHERVLLQHVSDMRSRLQALETIGGAPSAARSARVDQAALSLVALAEQYPDLKAEQRFHDLMDTSEETEDRIADRIKDYLKVVREYNVGNQGYWNNCYFTPLAKAVRLPAYWEYYYGRHAEAPGLPAEDILAADQDTGRPERAKSS